MVTSRAPSSDLSGVLLVGGQNLTPGAFTTPAGATARWCQMCELVERARRLRPRCIVVDATALPRGKALIEAARAEARGAVVIVVGDPAQAPDCADFVVAPVGHVTSETARLIRFALGQTVRGVARARCGGRAVVELTDGQSVDLAIRDLSEAGIRLTAMPGLPDARTVWLRIVLPDAPELAVRARPVRRAPPRTDGDESIGYRFVELDAHARAILRRILLRSGDRTVSSAPVRRTSTPPVDVTAATSRPETFARALIGTSPRMRRAIETLRRVAPTDATVLLLGETGTGKELAARVVHDWSPRADRSFVAVNCAALPDNLVESELFGHEAGAFTGALRRKIGRLEQASGGTLFLDEIGDLAAAAQAKLLRALQERAIERLGGHDPIRIDIRLVAATNHDLEAALAEKSFRRDLFFRLNVVTVTLPPLRDRGEDVVMLARHFLLREQQRMGKLGLRLGEHAEEALLRHAWPGNVRELENLCTRLVALAPSGCVLGPEHLGLVASDDPPASPMPSADLRGILDYCEREIIRRMLERNGGNRTRTAEALGITRQGLQQKLARFRDDDEGASG